MGRSIVLYVVSLLSRDSCERMFISQLMFLSLISKLLDKGKNCIQEELYHFHAALDAVQVIKSSRMKKMGHEAYKGESRWSMEYWFGNLRERDRLEDSGVDGMDFKKMACMDVDWIHMVWGRDKLWAYVSMVINIQEFVVA